MPARTLLWTGAVTLAMATAAHAAMTISNASTNNVSCTSGVCTPTGANPNLNTGDLESLLASSEVTVKSNAAAPDIGILDPLTWASSHRLTLDAYESVHVRAPVVVEGKAGLRLKTNDGGSGGDYTFNTATSGAIAFWDLASSFAINGRNYALVNDIKTLASDITANPSGNYALAESYDAAKDGTYADAPVGNELQGIFEGLGNTISNLTVINRGSSPLGFFAWSSGMLRDLNLRNAVVSSGDFSTVGTLVGVNSGGAVRVSTSGKASAGEHGVVGGLVGSNRDGALIIDSVSATEVKGQSGGVAGGIAGENDGRILLSKTSGTVQGGYFVGGLVGNNDGVIEESYESGSVKGRIAGGLIGDDEHHAGIIRQCYATGEVRTSGAGVSGGLIGREEGNTVSECYATGLVPTNRNSGGFAGETASNSTFRRAYWDISTTGQNAATADGDFRGITGLTDDQLRSALPAGFDPNVWGQSAGINNGWPYLLANPPQ